MKFNPDKLSTFDVEGDIYSNQTDNILKATLRANYSGAFIHYSIEDMNSNDGLSENHILLKQERIHDTKKLLADDIKNKLEYQDYLPVIITSGGHHAAFLAMKQDGKDYLISLDSIEGYMARVLNTENLFGISIINPKLPSVNFGNRCGDFSVIRSLRAPIIYDAIKSVDLTDEDVEHKLNGVLNSKEMLGSTYGGPDGRNLDVDKFDINSINLKSQMVGDVISSDDEDQEVAPDLVDRLFENPKSAKYTGSEILNDYTPKVVSDLVNRLFENPRSTEYTESKVPNNYAKHSSSSFLSSMAKDPVIYAALGAAAIGLAVAALTSVTPIVPIVIIGAAITICMIKTLKNFSENKEVAQSKSL